MVVDHSVFSPNQSETRIPLDCNELRQNIGGRRGQVNGANGHLTKTRNHLQRWSNFHTKMDKRSAQNLRMCRIHLGSAELAPARPPLFYKAKCDHPVKMDIWNLDLVKKMSNKRPPITQHSLYYTHNSLDKLKVNYVIQTTAKKNLHGRGDVYCNRTPMANSNGGIWLRSASY